MTPRARGTTAKRAALWCLGEITTLRRILIQRAGGIILPAGKLILSMNSNENLENELSHFLGRLKALGVDSQVREFMQQSGLSYCSCSLTIK